MTWHFLAFFSGRNKTAVIWANRPEARPSILPVPEGEEPGPSQMQGEICSLALDWRLARRKRPPPSSPPPFFRPSIHAMVKPTGRSGAALFFPSSSFPCPRVQRFNSGSDGRTNWHTGSSQSASDRRPMIQCPLPTHCRLDWIRSLSGLWSISMREGRLFCGHDFSQDIPASFAVISLLLWWPAVSKWTIGRILVS